MHRIAGFLAALALAIALLAPAAPGPRAQERTAQPPIIARPVPGPGSEAGPVLLTIFLRHDQSKPLGEINAELRRQGFYTRFPPPGIEVVSWYVMMGLGQVVTLRVPADRLREVNRIIEETAWGAYRTEFYPTYDYRAAAEEARKAAAGQ